MDLQQGTSAIRQRATSVLTFRFGESTMGVPELARPRFRYQDVKFAVSYFGKPPKFRGLPFRFCTTAAFSRQPQEAEG